MGFAREYGGEINRAASVMQSRMVTRPQLAVLPEIRSNTRLLPDISTTMSIIHRKVRECGEER
jgi:hypothetical protein